MIQVIKRACCKTIFAACIDGEQDSEWNKQLADYEKKGCIVSYVETATIDFRPCKCKKEPIPFERIIDPNQLDLFK